MNRKNFLTLLCVFLLANFFQSAKAQNQAGTPDSAFGTGGEVITPLASYEMFNDFADMALLPDGKIIAVGTVVLSGVPPSGGSSGVRFLLVRYNADGSLDTSFGDAGKSMISMNADVTARSIAIQPDGKILVAGDGVYAQIARDIVVARYNSDGSLDASFGAGGVVFTDLAGFGQSSIDVANKALLQPDGKIIITALKQYSGNQQVCALIQFHSDGNSDFSFGNAGKVFFSISPDRNQISSASLQADGRILVSGNSTLLPAAGSENSITTSFVGRFNSDGGIDTSFCGSGFCDYAPVFPKVKALAKQKIMVASGLNLFRHNADGMVDSSFLFSPPVVNGRNPVIKEFYVEADGTIAVLAMTGTQFLTDIVLSRYSADGRLDTSFGANGVVLKTSQDYIEGRQILVQPDGKVLIGFQHNNSSAPYRGYFALARYLGIKKRKKSTN